MKSVIACLLLCLLQTTVMADTESDMARGTQALVDGRFEEAVEIFNAIAMQQPEDGAVRYRLGTALMSLDRLDEAAIQFQAAREANFQPGGASYRMARIRGRQGKNDEALGHVEDMAASGFAFPSLLENEPDFEGLKDDPQYAAAMELVATNRFPCRGDQSKRQFDFWLGDWDVTSLGQPAGSSSVQSILGDCVVFENWESVAGTSGKSFNFYDAGEDHWRQIWVDDTSGVIEFTGSVRDGVMYYTASTRDPQTHAATRHKLTFTPNEDGSVRQFWEQSTDDGETWTTAFDGHYARKAK